MSFTPSEVFVHLLSFVFLPPGSEPLCLCVRFLLVALVSCAPSPGVAA
jgi:hypothetical protein